MVAMKKSWRELSLGYKFKVVLAFFIFNAAVSAVLSFSAYNILQTHMLKEFEGRTNNLAQLGSYLLDKPALKRLVHLISPGLSADKVSAVEQSVDFRHIAGQLNRLRDIDKRLIRFAYIIRPSDDGRHRYVADADTLSDIENAEMIRRTGGKISRFNAPFDASTFPVFQRAVHEKKYLVEKEFFYDPVYKVRSITAYAPILDGDSGKIIAVLCMDMTDTNVEAALRESRYMSLSIMAVSLVLSLMIAFTLGHIFSRGILALDRVVRRYAQKDFSARSSIKSADEIGKLSFSLNYMAEMIQNYAETLENLLSAYGRFVPKHFLQVLNKKSITEVRLGDQVQHEMSILFSDIRSFTALSESMTPVENFNFINSYLKRVGPTIRFNNGFIDKYLGDGIMALFPREPDDAVIAAIEMIRKVDEYNGHRTSSGRKPIKIGIGIHTGLLMLGTIGEDERMDGSVISDAVNLCSRLEGLTKVYGVPIIISKETLSRLKDPVKYHIRFLDKTRVKGKSVPISLYEVFSQDHPDIRAKKDSSKQMLESGIKLYFERNLRDALTIFRSLQKDHPEDTLIGLYIGRCEKYLKEGIPEDWTGGEAPQTF
jgi:class 3 adenylate cyclase/HAMP domain-containing protein